MAHLLESGEFSDAVLIARGGVAFRCHRNILAARWEHALFSIFIHLTDGTIFSIIPPFSLLYMSMMS